MKDDKALSEITSIEKATGYSFVHFNYQIPESLTLTKFGNEGDIKFYGDMRVIMELAQLTDTDIQLRKLTDSSIVSVSSMSIDEYKEYVISESKTKLASFLKENPLLIDIGYGENLYNVCEANVTRLKNRINDAKANDMSFIEWHAIGQMDHTMEVTDAVLLANAIDEYVMTFVKAQQAFELQINQCTSKMDVDTLNIDYNQCKK